MRQRNAIEKKVSFWRLLALFFIFGSIFAVIFWRVFTLSVIDRHFLTSQGNARSLCDVKVGAYRGALLDRNKSVLAVSTPVMAVWCVPKQFDLKQTKLVKLAELLQLPLYKLKQRIKAHRNRQFLYLQRGLAPKLAEQIKALKLENLYLQKRKERRALPVHH